MEFHDIIFGNPFHLQWNTSKTSATLEYFFVVDSSLCEKKPCDMAGAAAACKTSCSGDDTKVPAKENTCTSKEKCCRFKCADEGSFCLAKGTDVKARGLEPETPKKPCPAEGICVKEPPQPDNWPAGYPWPPVYYWPPGYVFPADYSFPDFWPSYWAPLPPTVYPPGVAPLPPPPAPSTGDYSYATDNESTTGDTSAENQAAVNASAGGNGNDAATDASAGGDTSSSVGNDSGAGGGYDTTGNNSAAGGGYNATSNNPAAGGEYDAAGNTSAAGGGYDSGADTTAAGGGYDAGADSSNAGGGYDTGAPPQVGKTLIF